MVTEQDHLSKKICEHLQEWLERHKEEAAMVPNVQRALEEAQWQHRARTFLGSIAPQGIYKTLDANLDRSYQQITNSLPLQPQYGQHVVSAIVTGVTSSSSPIVSAVYTLSNSPVHRDTAQRHLREYHRLQELQHREAKVRQLLERTSPTLAAQFDLARSTQLLAKSQPDKYSDASSHIRILLDRFKGELFAQAMRTPRDNMSWNIMIDRLFPSTKPVTEREILVQEWNNRQTLYERLSSLTKRRDEPKADEISHLWTMTLDHLYVVCVGIDT